MHLHSCRYCLGEFVCDTGADECFKTWVTCDGCWLSHDFKYFLLMLPLGAIAIFLTIVFFRLTQHP